MRFRSFHRRVRRSSSEPTNGLKKTVILGNPAAQILTRSRTRGSAAIFRSMAVERQRSASYANPVARGALVALCGFAAGSCSHTLVETFYEFRPAGVAVFVQPGDYTDCGGTYFRSIHELANGVSLTLGRSKVEEYRGHLELSFHNFHSRNANAVMLSDQFTIFTGDERIRKTLVPKRFFDHRIYELNIPPGRESFFVKAPDIEIDGTRYEIPLIEFRKTTGKRRKASGISCW